MTNVCDSAAIGTRRSITTTNMLTTVIIIFIVDTIKVSITKFLGFDADSTCTKIEMKRLARARVRLPLSKEDTYLRYYH